MSNNPLKQFFRRPALYLKLPSGGTGYTPDIVQVPENGELPVYPMTAIDEITSKTPDALFNGMAVVDIIKSCVPAIKDPWKITSVDLDSILVAIRAATNGNDMDIESICPECGEDSKYGLNLSTILAGFKPGDYSSTLKVGTLAIKFRPLTFFETNNSQTVQFEIQRIIGQLNDIEDEDKRLKASSEGLVKINEASMNLIATSIESISNGDDITVTERSFIVDYLKNCDRKTYDKIREHSMKLRETTETKPLHFTCINCKHEYDQPFTLNISDFFD
jgi:hypothetical protein